MTRYISCPETAKLLREELKQKFPGTKFSVRSHQYAGGASIRVAYWDGPSYNQVSEVCRFYTGATFDPMQDLKEYQTAEYQGETVHFGSDFVFLHRDYSESFLRRVLADIAAADHTDVPEIMVGSDGSAHLLYCDFYPSSIMQRVQSISDTAPTKGGGRHAKKSES